MKKFIAEEKRLLFSETDMSNWAHNSHFMRWVENAEHELWYKLGTVPVSPEGGWPRVHFKIDFRSPLVLNDPYQVSLSLKRLGGSSVTWGFEIHSRDRLVAEGEMVSVLVDKNGRATKIPDALRAGITETFT